MTETQRHLFGERMLRSGVLRSLHPLVDPGGKHHAQYVAIGMAALRLLKIIYSGKAQMKHAQQHLYAAVQTASLVFNEPGKDTELSGNGNQSRRGEQPKLRPWVITLDNLHGTQSQNQIPKRTMLNDQNFLHCLSYECTRLRLT